MCVSLYYLVKANYYNATALQPATESEVHALRTYSREITTTTGAAQKPNRSEIEENSTGRHSHIPMSMFTLSITGLSVQWFNAIRYTTNYFVSHSCDRVIPRETRRVFKPFATSWDRMR
ncbi:hypothetical protein ANAPC5_01380 [Anaplasma phagocytophilum]|nr:hypothetical protein ANAPC5_01380 [Anaplasma phagocytophilum]